MFRDVARLRAPGVNALLVPPADAGALADAITQLSRDKGLRRKFGEAGRRLVENEYSAVRIGTDIVTLYNHLLDCKR